MDEVIEPTVFKMVPELPPVHQVALSVVCSLASLGAAILTKKAYGAIVYDMTPIDVTPVNPQ